MTTEKRIAFSRSEDWIALVIILGLFGAVIFLSSRSTGREQGRTHAVYHAVRT